MDRSRVDAREIARRLEYCLRHSYALVRPALLSLRELSWTPTLLTLFQPAQDTSTMIVSTVWKRRLEVSFRAAGSFIGVVLIYLLSELIIWGLSRTLAPVHREFFASILGMALVFLLMTTAFVCFRGDRFYQRHIRSKGDFINTHLGLGFPVPLVMLDENEILSGPEIARVMGNFVMTNIVSWTTVLAVSVCVMAMATRIRSRLAGDPNTRGLRSHAPRQPRDDILPLHEPDLARPFAHHEKRTPETTPEPNSDSSQCMSQYSIEVYADRENDRSKSWRFFSRHFPITASLFAIFVVGAPVAAATGEQRILDGCMLWFLWISSVRGQKHFKASMWFSRWPRLKNAMGTAMNPVLATTLLMTAYTRAKAAAPNAMTLLEVLDTFSSGTPLYALWTAATTGEPLPNGMSYWFGAGDAALSILECGLVVWGFKLFECRRQLFSIAGILTILISVAAAAANVYLSVLSGRTMGLQAPESLAFAARCTTLALAKPGMSAVGGNKGVNAALVVSNGILGQLMYPFALDKLGVARHDDSTPVSSSSHANDHDNAQRSINDEYVPTQRSPYGAKEASSPSLETNQQISDMSDGPVTIAAGITIGINGAAMGVAYLYETRSRAAPYAALAMTVFGVMTVLFTTVEPFRGTVMALAS